MSILPKSVADRLIAAGRTLLGEPAPGTELKFTIDAKRCVTAEQLHSALLRNLDPSAVKNLTR